MANAKKSTLRERIAVRAYYDWQNGAPGTHEDHWRRAEAVELAALKPRAPRKPRVLSGKASLPGLTGKRSRAAAVLQ